MNHYAMDTRFDEETAKKNDFGASFSKWYDARFVFVDDIKFCDGISLNFIPFLHTDRYRF